jgi:integrase
LFILAKGSAKIFAITYNAARKMVSKTGKVAGINMGPHDLRHFSATYEFRAGIPIEIA